MSFDFRVAVDYSYGTLSAGATTLDTTLNSEMFRNLPSNLSMERYLPITLAEDSARRWEVVWVVGHGSNSTAIEVVRAREDTDAGTWPSGSSWRCAPTARDGTIAAGTTSIDAQYPDPHIGMRAVLVDVPKVVEWTDAGWQDAAPHGPGRMHGWKQLNAPLQNGVWTKITGMGAYGTNAVASYDNSSVRLNRPGVWTLTFAVWSYAYTANTTMECSVSWPGGHPGLNGSQTGRVSQSGYLTAAHQTLHINWTGYVEEDWVNLPISFFVVQYNQAGHVVGNLDYYVTMYYLGN